MAEQWTRDARALAERRRAVTDRGRRRPTTPVRVEGHMPGALEGLRVVDLTTGLAGPIATMTLSDHGADVVKVEPARWRSAARLRGFGGHQPREAQRGARPRRRQRPRAAARAGRHRRRARRELRARVPGRARARLRPRRGRPAVADLLLAHRLPTHDRRRRPPGHRPAGAGALGHAVRAARLPRRPDLPARAAAEHRRVVPHGRRRARRALRARAHRTRAVGGDVALPGCALVHDAALAGPRAPGRAVVRDRVRAASEHLRVRRRPLGALDALRRRSGQGPQHRVEILGIDPPDLEWNPTGGQAFEEHHQRGDRPHEASGPARPVLGPRDPDRAGAPRARGARGRAGDQQRDVGGGRRPGARPGAAGRHLVPRARARRRRRCRARSPRSASTPTRCSARSATSRHARASARPAKRRGHARARGHQGPRPRQLPRGAVRADAARRPRRDRLQARVAAG